MVKLVLHIPTCRNLRSQSLLPRLVFVCLAVFLFISVRNALKRQKDHRIRTRHANKDKHNLYDDKNMGSTDWPVEEPHKKHKGDAGSDDIVIGDEDGDENQGTTKSPIMDLDDEDEDDDLTEDDIGASHPRGHSDGNSRHHGHHKETEVDHGHAHKAESGDVNQEEDSVDKAHGHEGHRHEGHTHEGHQESHHQKDHQPAESEETEHSGRKHHPPPPNDIAWADDVVSGHGRHNPEHELGRDHLDHQGRADVEHLTSGHANHHVQQHGDQVEHGDDAKTATHMEHDRMSAHQQDHHRAPEHIDDVAWSNDDDNDDEKDANWDPRAHHHNGRPHPKHDRARADSIDPSVAESQHKGEWGEYYRGELEHGPEDKLHHRPESTYGHIDSGRYRQDVEDERHRATYEGLDSEHMRRGSARREYEIQERDRHLAMAEPEHMEQHKRNTKDDDAHSGGEHGRRHDYDDRDERTEHGHQAAGGHETLYHDHARSVHKDNFDDVTDQPIASTTMSDDLFPGNNDTNARDEKLYYHHNLPKIGELAPGQDREDSKYDMPDPNVRICSQRQRQHYLRAMCDQLMDPKKEQEKYMNRRLKLVAVNHKRKLLYCVLPKTGSRSWLNFMVNLSSEASSDKAWQIRDEEFMADAGLEYRKKLPLHELEKYYRDYTKFVVVRHPLQRFAAAYYEAVVKNHNFKRKDGKLPSFREFAGDMASRTIHPQVQMARYINHCQICRTKYDYILKTETIESDMKMFTSDLETNVHLPRDHVNKVYKGRHHSDMFKYDPLLATLRPEEDDIMRGLMSVYKTDMKAFGYGWDYEDGRSTCSVVQGDKPFPCC